MRRHKREVADKIEDQKEAQADRKDREVKKVDAEEERIRDEKDKQAKKAA